MNPGLVATNESNLARRLATLELQVRQLVQVDSRPRLILGGGGSKIIEFIVDSDVTIDNTESPFDGMRELTVTVKSPDCNNRSLHGASVKVYEHQPDCLTGDEADGELTGRKGWAYEGVHQDMSASAEVGDLGPCHWVLMGLCCQP